MMSKMILAVLTVGLMNQAHAEPDDVTLKLELQRIARQKIVFGHQSVGMNILEGIRKISSRSGIPLQIAEINSIDEVNAPMIAHSFIAENEHPDKKLGSFTRLLESKHHEADLAFMKFCFIDFKPDTDAKGLFAQYSKTMEKLESAHPNTIFIHVTTPLHVVEGGPMATIKYWLGLSPLYGTRENLRREEYNEMLRQKYLGHEPIFDLAKIESTRPDGKVEKVEWGGRTIPVLVPEYSSDGGHLNEEGAELAARGLISVLASVPGHSGRK